MGRIVNDCGYRFVWPPSEEPYLQKGSGPIIKCAQVQHVPMVMPASEIKGPLVEGEPDIITDDEEITPPEVGLPKEEPLEECQPCLPDLVPKPQKPRQGQPIPESHYINRFPKHPDCEICNQCKTNRAQHRKASAERLNGVPDDATKPTAFAEEVTTDHMIFNEDEYSRHGDKVSLVIQDRATIWLRSYGANEESAHEVRSNHNWFTQMDPRKSTHQ